MLRNLILLFSKIIYEKSDFVFYTIQNTNGENTKFSNSLKFYPDYKSGKNVAGKILRNRFVQPLYHRFRAGKAQLITWEENEEIMAYGWLQSWEPFKVKFGKIYPDATMLGPYYTLPQERGKGIYKKLLAFSLHHCTKEKPIAIYTSRNNISSQKGIEGSGFSKIGLFRVQLYFRVFSIVEKLEE